MLPIITDIVSLDIYRDGGSVGISFLGEGKHWHELFFPIDRQYQLDEQNRIVGFIGLGYLAPMLKTYTPIGRRRKHNHEFNTEEQSLTWEEATKLLETMNDLVVNLQTNGKLEQLDVARYYKMLDASKNQRAKSR
ncbi:hypothetical protein [Chamaesiphon polymorphus]|uniref:Uncharacterized protein n=1 Tax=Chamaesiphon polymorphus CCALA 037 TaxID=2107692 RepID=A0A2T1G4T5_9CYAN|nr:hypothetical protein [Chamaesiphon polymorphus]PSB52170.1 hypothetical protein C7B77_20800 [Chamaesiphon polymorphus CCALA 037]